MAKKRRKKIKINTHIARKTLIIGIILILIGGYLSLKKGDEKPQPLLQRPPVETELIDRVNEFIKKNPLRDDQIGLYIYDLTSDAVLYEKNENQLMPPASCTKLVTAIASLGRFGLDYPLNDSLFYQGTLSEDALYGNLILKADADPLTRDFSHLIQVLKDKGIRKIYGSLKLHLPLREAMKLHSSWEKHDMRVTSLPVFFQGKEVAERVLRNELKSNGILLNEEAPTITETYPKTFLAAETHTLKEVFFPVLKYSSNITAQCIWTTLNGKHYPLLPEQDDKHDFLMDFIGKELRQPAYQYILSDACGLSPENRLSAKFLVNLLHWAWVREDIRNYLLESLPIAGNLGAEKSGSLHWRMEKSAAANKVFAKTGTLNRLQVTSLSGFLQTKNGHWLAFSILNKDLIADISRPYQDKLCIELCR